MFHRVVFMLIAVVWIPIAFYVANDAAKRNKNPIFWFLFSLLLGLLALLIYNISITPDSDSRNKNTLSGTSDNSQYSGNHTTGQTGDLSYSIGWSHELLELNVDGDPVVKVSEGEKSGKFVIANDIRAYSQIPKQKHGEEWVGEAKEHLRNSFEP